MEGLRGLLIPRRFIAVRLLKVFFFFFFVYIYIYADAWLNDEYMRYSVQNDVHGLIASWLISDDNSMIDTCSDMVIVI